MDFPRTIRDDLDLARKLAEAVAKVKAMTPEELDEMLRVQREGYVKAECSWPRDCPYR